MKSSKTFKLRQIALTASIVCAGFAAQVGYAQTSLATIRGTVSAAGVNVAEGVEVIATNVATGAVARVKTQGNGSYSLIGLAPGTYHLKVVGKGIDQKVEDVTVQVGENAALNIAVATGASTTLNQVIVVGNANRLDAKNSSVGTTVTTKQIDATPQNSRNFLAFADQAPGVRFQVDPSSGYGKLQSGSQNQDNVNVFIDGVSQKNNILRGGVSGMDSSRGNPFPQSAIQEYKVISQNYKAEFDQVSSAAIIAVTKSGTNTLKGEVFYDFGGTKFTQKTPFEDKAEAAGVTRASSDNSQYGMSIGGAIKEDVLHYFVSYEGKDISTPRYVLFNQSLPDIGIFPTLKKAQGSTASTFKEDLVFGRIDATLDNDQKLTFTARVRQENDRVPENSTLSSPTNMKGRSNDDTHIDLKHEWRNDQWFNEARIGYEDARWMPNSDNNTNPLIKYVTSPTNDANNTKEFLYDGGSPDAQDKRQRGLFLQNDFTYTGWLDHSVKVGAKIKDNTFDLSGSSRGVDILTQVVNTTTGVATTIQTDTKLPALGVSLKDTQYGIYVQDDWQVNNKLELNLGVRYDYETNMLNNDYVTPADRIAIFDKQDPRAGAPVGQTYAQSLAKGGVNIKDYYATGNRKPFTGALAPRLGFSYDLNGDLNTVLFGGMGRSYDRTMANNALDELQKNAVAGGEIWMIRNDYKMPFTDQIAFGVRQKLSDWNTEIGYTYSHSQNQFNWFGGNRDVNGGWGTQSPIDPLWGSVPGFGTLILGDFISEALTRTVYLKADKPYTRASGWSAAITYTYSDGLTTNKEWTNDIFNWTYGKTSAGWNPSKDVEKHRIVASGMMDNLLPWDMMLSGKFTWGSGLPYRITNCAAGWSQCVSVKGDGDKFQQFDIAISKDFKLGGNQKIVIRTDILNLFNTVNYGGYDDWGGGPGNSKNYLGGDNANLGTPTAMAGPMRTLKFGLKYVF